MQRKHLIRIDFGSGYNPTKGFSTCDFTNSPFLDYQVIKNKIYNKKGKEILKNSVDEIRCRNVLHHIKNLEDLLKQFFYYLKNNGKLTIIECNKSNYLANICLDNLWYRYVIPRKEIWISNNYRDYRKYCNLIGFKEINNKIYLEKEYSIFKKLS